MSPGLQAIAGRILLVLPELESALGSLQPGNVCRETFQLAFGEDLAALAGRWFFHLLKGCVDTIPVFRLYAHGPWPLAHDWQHRLPCAHRFN